MKTWSSIFTAVFLLIAGCDGDSSNRTTPPSSAPTNSPATAIRTIAVLGGPTRLNLLAQLGTIRQEADHQVVTLRKGSTELKFIADASDDIVAQGRLAFQADAALLTVDATLGPVPIDREHVLLARQMGLRELCVVLTQCAKVDDLELLELEELELRELLNLYRMGGDMAKFAVDDEKAAVARRLPRVTQLADSLISISPRATSPAPATHTRFGAEIYVLARQEAFNATIAGSIESGPATLLIAGEDIQVTVDAVTPIKPSQNGQAGILFPKPMAFQSGQRFAFLRNRHIAAVGVLTLNEH